MDDWNAAWVEQLLEGVELPAAPPEIAAYAAAQGAPDALVERLRQLRRRSYASIDEVGEELRPVRPAARSAPPPLPRQPAGPPGGEAYVRPRAPRGG